MESITKFQPKPKKEGGWGNFFFPAPSWYTDLEKASFQMGFYRTSHKDILIPATASGWHHSTVIIAQNFFGGQVKGIFKSANDTDMQEFRALL